MLRLFAAHLILVCALFAPASLRAAFGVTDNGGSYTVDTGAGLVFTVDKDTGVIPSILWNGTELNGNAKGSSLSSGFGGVTTTVTASANCIILTCTTGASHDVIPDLTHYYVVQKGVNTLYMATLAPRGCTVGELRWITRLKEDLFPSAPVYSDTRGTVRTIESRDVFGKADGSTRSKYYGNQRAMDLSLRGITGPGRGVFMVYGSREGSSGGPFYRDIQNQTTEVYNYMNSGHAQTEAWRDTVLHGPYALCFTTGATPALPDMRFMAGLGLKGYVGPAGRGYVTCGGIAGRDSRYPYVVGFANGTAQYWTVATATDGSFTMTGMLPGTYTMQVYKNELSVYTDDNVTVAAGSATALKPITITNDPGSVTPVWRIGEWDGTPREFLNGNKINYAHPSDKRMSDWNPGTYIVGVSAPATGMQACQWMDVPGSNKTIEFTLTAGQITASTLKIGLTCATDGARPNISINSWHGSPQRPSAQPTTRTLTVGSYRGNNVTYTFSVPASALVVGKNTLHISPLSGSGGDRFLSPGYGFDCIEFSQESSRQ